MITSCRRAVELATEALDTPLPLNKKLALFFHRLACSACRRFRRQMGEIDRVVGDYVDETIVEPDGIGLTEESKTRIKAALHGAERDGETNSQ